MSDKSSQISFHIVMCPPEDDQTYMLAAPHRQTLPNIEETTFFIIIINMYELQGSVLEQSL